VAYDSGGPYADSVAIADLNGDGIPDLVVTNACQSGYQGYCDAPGASGEVAVLLGNSDGTFQPAATYSTGAYVATSVAVGDLNGDGVPDLVVANSCQYGGEQCGYFTAGQVSVLLGNGDGTFQPAVTYSSGGDDANSVAVGDLNGDGYPDLVVVNFDSSSIGVLLGNGDGTFQAPVTYPQGSTYPVSVAIGDLNGDGKLDVVASTYFQIGGQDGGVIVLLGNGDGTLQAAVSYSSGGYYPGGVALGDLNGDGHLDVAVANSYGSTGHGAVGVLLGNGDGTFQAPFSYSWGGQQANAVTIGDVNGDGHTDLVVAVACVKDHYGYCYGAGVVSILLGNGDGTFQTPAVDYPSGGFVAGSVAVADLNGDGRPDIVVSNGCTHYDQVSPCRTDGTVGVLLNSLLVATSTHITSSLDPSQVSQSVTFTVTVKSNLAVPNGTVIAFSNDGMGLGTATTTDGVANLTTSFSAAGRYTIEASYAGDLYHEASSGTVKQVVRP
jgi:hypothetical protein